MHTRDTVGALVASRKMFFVGFGQCLPAVVSVVHEKKLRQEASTFYSSLGFIFVHGHFLTI